MQNIDTKQNIFLRILKGIGNFLLLFTTHYLVSGLTVAILLGLCILLAPTFIGKFIFGILNLDSNMVLGENYSLFGGICGFAAWFSFFSCMFFTEKFKSYKQLFALGIWITISEVALTILSIASSGFSSLLLDKLAFLVLGIAFIYKGVKKTGL